MQQWKNTKINYLKKKTHNKVSYYSIFIINKIFNNKKYRIEINLVENLYIIL